MPKTYGWLADQLAAKGIRARLEEEHHVFLPRHPLGAELDGLQVATEVAAVDFRAVLAPTSNPHLVARRVELGLERPLPPIVEGQPPIERRFERTPQERLQPRRDPHLERRLRPQDAPEPEPPVAPEPPAGGTASVVDWRNRWGSNWVTTVRDQNPCSSCWAFAGTALVEAMLRVETSYWARLSEGDLHDGVGSHCADGNNLGNVDSFLSANGLADPGCWPYRTDDPVYAPSPDRNGRSVRVPRFTWVGSVADQKKWIDSTGPLATWFDVYEDFDGHPAGHVYRRSTDPSNHERGGHFLLVVGYDDGQQAWICKNSWGDTWCDHGYVLVGYGEAGIDQYAKAGLTGLNPDPWTKHRLSNGVLYESGNGAMHRNLEVVSASGPGVVTHRWREGGPPWTWGTSDHFASDAAVCPTMRGTTYNRNLELVYLTRSGRLHHWWRGGGGGPWNDGGVFGPAGCQGVPGFVQGDYGAPGNFEVVVKVAGNRLQHLWRRNGAPWTWSEGPTFGSDIALSGATLVQGDYLANGHGNLEVVAVRSDGRMQHFWRSASDLVWHPGTTFGSGVGSTPVMIQGQYGMRNEAGPHGNFELVVARGGAIEHWWRDNASGSMTWRQSATFGSGIQTAVGLCQSSWGMNLEVIAMRTDGQLQHFWRDGGGWHPGPVVGPA
jgi:hypothetical protein